MTAVAGLWRYTGEGGADRETARMAAALADYGRDAAGQSVIAGTDLALICRQSHITDTDMLDRQPVWDRDGHLCGVADARIDNRAELAAAFGWARREGEQASDVALILTAYRQWGPDCVTRLTGDFAFALWDNHRQHLMLARDHYGSRPLFFARGPGLFAFASMPRGLFALSEISPALDPQEVGAYLALLPPAGTATLYRDVSRVPPGHSVLVRGEQQTLIRYWQPPPQQAAGARDYREHVEEFRRLYTDAVRVRLRVRPGGGIGSHLSAGFDSSSVTALAGRILSEQGRRLTAFTAAPRPGFAAAESAGRVTDESAVAAEIARQVGGIDHCILRAGPDSLLRTLERTLPSLQAPFLNLCNLGWIRAIEQDAARRGIKVLLHGGAGNLTVSADGLTLFSQLFRRGRWVALAKLARGAVSDGLSWRGVAAHTVGPSLPPWLLDRVRGRRGGVFSYAALSPAFAASVDLGGLAAARGRTLSYHQTAGDGRAARLRALGQADPGPYHHATLAQFGLETTDPTTDRRLMDFCLQTPDAFLIRQGRRASLFRDAFQGMLPDSMLNRRIRGVQAADWPEGLMAARDDIAAELERLEASALASQVLDVQRMRGLLAGLPDPASPGPPDAPSPHDWCRTPEAVASYRMALLRGLSVGRFIRMVEGGNG